MAQQSIQIVIPVAVTVNIKGGTKYNDQEVINNLRLRSTDSNIKVKGLTLAEEEPA